jgi:hypothetical protein
MDGLGFLLCIVGGLMLIKVGDRAYRRFRGR